MYQFVNFDESATLEEAIAAFETETGETLYAGDERRLMLNSFMYIAKIIAEKSNYVANQYLIQTADEEHLLLLGEGRGVPRLEAESALVEIKFSLASAQSIDITIPEGTRVTADGIVFFATMEAGTISAGTTYITIPCEATVSGEIGNEYAIGTIQTLCDSIMYIASVTNTSESAGGTEIEDLEDYRTRCLLKPYSYNTAGASEAYRYLALSADNIVGSVSVDSSDDVVTITVLCKDGSIPDDLIISRVQSALTDKTVKPITDNIVVQAPTAVSYEINTSYTISSSDSTSVSTIQTSVNAAVEQYVADLAELGKSVNPDELRKYMLNAGACTVTINQPSTFISVDADEVAVLSGDITCTYSGLC